MVKEFTLFPGVFTMAAAPTVTPDRVNQTVRKPYPNYKVIVLNDDFNTFDHVAKCLMQYIPGMSSDRAWELTNQVHYEGQAIVWVGPQEPAELYHQQLRRAGLTMAPLEAA
ncbi:ATP-dependent Clp protease adapter ClpS [Anabaena sp. FACHB-1237]|uniref:ATP-dependent Clp protease adapter ClpS n=1 Tax=Anabaena sp. FACHB-1237 TaxID=2692769 RepID=UPI001680C9E8|nr:ATP-dependent Clp protease adapter ClpS [Anabaena sp. FACHB-1237]MBD2137983.1 ATP-dependent Clp protease adapter ClpS [Anabaena sp. FACHB-1237]